MAEPLRINVEYLRVVRDLELCALERINPSIVGWYRRMYDSGRIKEMTYAEREVGALIRRLNRVGKLPPRKTLEEAAERIFSATGEDRERIKKAELQRVKDWRPHSNHVEFLGNPQEESSDSLLDQ